MQMILRNIRDLCRHHTFFFVLTICSVFASSLIMLFAFGLYQNYKMEQQAFTTAQTSISFDFYIIDPETGQRALSGVQRGELQTCLEALHPDVLANTQQLTVGYHAPESKSMMLFSRFLYQQGKYAVTPEHEDNLRIGAQIESGRFYTEAEYAEGAKVILATADMLNENGMVTMGDTELTPIMITNTMPDVPFLSVPATQTVQFMDIAYHRPPTATQVTALMDAFRKAFGERVTLPEVEVAMQEDFYLYNTILLIAVLIAVVASVNIVILYYYILLKRRKALAVCMLCGCTKGKAIAMYVGESLVLSIPLFGLSALLYHTVVLPLLSNILPFIETAYSVKLYAVALGIYIGICTLGMWMLCARTVYKQSIVSMKAGDTV